MTLDKAPKLWPRHGTSTGPPIEPKSPNPKGRLIELHKTPDIRGSPIVLVMALQLPVEGFLLFLYRIMPMRFAPGRHSHDAAPESLAHRSNMYHKLPIPAAFAQMRESKKVESGRLHPSRLF